MKQIKQKPITDYQKHINKVANAENVRMFNCSLQILRGNRFETRCMKSVTINRLEKELAALREQAKRSRQKISGQRRRLKAMKAIQGNPAKAEDPAIEPSVKVPENHSS